MVLFGMVWLDYKTAYSPVRQLSDDKICQTKMQVAFYSYIISNCMNLRLHYFNRCACFMTRDDDSG